MILTFTKFNYAEIATVNHTAVFHANFYFSEVRATEDVRSSTTEKQFRFIGNSFEITLKIIITLIHFIC